MLSIQLIDKTLQQRDHDRLLRELCRNGLIMPLPLRVRLGRSAHGAAGLGLRRLVELTYGPTALSRELTDQLTHAIHPGLGVLDDDAAPCPVLTAAVCAGLGRLIRDHGQLLGDHLPAVAQAHQLGIDALQQMQGHDGLFAGPIDRTAGDRLLVSAFIAYLLIDDHAFAARCRRHTLLTALEEAQDQAEPQTADLIEMARMTGPTPPQPQNHQPNLPALAA